MSVRTHHRRTAVSPIERRYLGFTRPASFACTHDTRAMLDAGGFEEGSQSASGHYAVERAFVS